jgi:DNA-directed RNA polymerase specialized sigma24 family protein
VDILDDALRESLLRLVRHKFAGHPNVVLLADDIVQEAYLRLRAGRAYAPEKENYGYLSVVCVRLARAV